MVRAIAGVLTALLILSWCILLRPTNLGGSTSYVIVSGVSMEPLLLTGDLAVLRQQDTYDLGDVVAFQVQAGNVIHRIVGGSAEEGFVMRGDNKDGTDPWNPTPDQVLGKMWFFVPSAGGVLAYLRQPLPLAATIACLALLSLLGGGKARRRWRGGRGMAHQNSERRSGQLPGPAWAVAALAFFALLGLCMAAGAGYAFRLPVEKAEQVQRLRYEHTTAFDYTVRMQPSGLYPDGVVGPILPPSDPSAKTTPPALYSKLARSLDLGFNYALKSPLPPQLTGEISGVLEIKAGDKGWSKTVDLMPPTPFTGPTASARVTVDLAQIWSLIDGIEKETGFNPGSYDVAIIPTVHLKGRIGAETIDENYAPPFAMKLSRTQITLDDQLARSDVKKVEDAVIREQQIGLAGLALPVSAARWLGLAGSVTCLIIAALLAAFVFLGLGRDENGKIQARYGTMLIRVADVDLKQRTQVIQLASMDDLARLAQRDGQAIFHQGKAANSELFFVHHGDVVYAYTKQQPSEEE